MGGIGTGVETGMGTRVGSVSGAGLMRVASETFFIERPTETTRQKQHKSIEKV